MRIEEDLGVVVVCKIYDTKSPCFWLDASMARRTVIYKSQVGSVVTAHD